MSYYNVLLIAVLKVMLFVYEQTMYIDRYVALLVLLIAVSYYSVLLIAVLKVMLFMNKQCILINFLRTLYYVAVAKIILNYAWR